MAIHPPLPLSPAQILVANVLSPLPDELVKTIRAFAKQLGPWMDAALKDKFPALHGPMMETVLNSAQYLKRFTSLNHLAAATERVLLSKSQVWAGGAEVVEIS